MAKSRLRPSLPKGMLPSLCCSVIERCRIAAHSALSAHSTPAPRPPTATRRPPPAPRPPPAARRPPPAPHPPPAAYRPPSLSSSDTVPIASGIDMPSSGINMTAGPASRGIGSCARLGSRTCRHPTELAVTPHHPHPPFISCHVRQAAIKSAKVLQ